MEKLSFEKSVESEQEALNAVSIELENGKRKLIEDLEELEEQRKKWKGTRKKLKVTRKKLKKELAELRRRKKVTKFNDCVH